jgi:hypothetical protein
MVTKFSQPLCRFLIGSICSLLVSSYSVSGAEDGQLVPSNGKQLQTWPLKDTNLNLSIEDWAVKDPMYAATKALVSKHPFELCMLGYPIVREGFFGAYKYTGKSGRVIYASWSAEPQFTAAGMGIGGLLGGVCSWYAAKKGIAYATDVVAEAAVAEATTHLSTGGVTTTLPPGTLTTLYVAKKIYDYRDEITASATILGTMTGALAGGTAAAYAVLSKEEFAKAWERGWSREDQNAELKPSIKSIGASSFGGNPFYPKPSVDDMKRIMNHMDGLR